MSPWPRACACSRSCGSGSRIRTTMPRPGRSPPGLARSAPRPVAIGTHVPRVARTMEATCAGAVVAVTGSGTMDIAWPVVLPDPDAHVQRAGAAGVAVVLPAHVDVGRAPVAVAAARGVADAGADVAGDPTVAAVGGGRAVRRPSFPATAREFAFAQDPVVVGAGHPGCA